MVLFYCLKHTAQDVYAAEFGFDIYLKCRLCGISLYHISRLLFSDFLLCFGIIFSSRRFSKGLAAEIFHNMLKENIVKSAIYSLKFIGLCSL